MQPKRLFLLFLLGLLTVVSSFAQRTTSPALAQQVAAPAIAVNLPLIQQAGSAPGAGLPAVPTTPPAPLPPATTNLIWVAPTGADDASHGSQSAPLRTLAAACARAQSGQSIRLTAGEFREMAQCVLRSGVRVTGNGRSGASATTVYAPTAWNFSADGTNDNPAGYSIRVEQAQDVTIDQLVFRGNANTANGAVYLADAQRVTLRDLSVYDFRFTGLQLDRAKKIDVQNIYLENSGYEWPPNSSAQFPSGGSVGNLGVHNLEDAVFGFITIKTTALHGYGIKASNLSRVLFHNLDLDMHPFQSWMGPGPNNFDMEIHGGYAEQVVIAHSRFRQTLSLMGGNEPRYDAVPYTIHVHHNMFDMKNGTYSMEVGTDKMVVDHNWFRNTWTALQNYGDANTRINNLTVFNNVAENLSMRFVGLKGHVENLRVFGNTVYLSEGGGQSYLVTLGRNNGSKQWLLANNVIVGAKANSADSRQLAVVYEATTAPRDLQARNNLYRDIAMAVVADAPIDPAAWNHIYASNLEADPKLPTSGSSAFQPIASSPIVDRGDANIGIRSSFVGTGRDIGAFEFGQPAWQAGPGTVASEPYVWAPTTSLTQDAFVDSIDVDLAAAPGAEIRYTLDGTEPGAQAVRYTVPIRITQPVKLQARAFKDGIGSATALTLDLDQGVRGYPNLAAQGTATASSQYDTGYPPANVIDGITYSWVGWASAAGDKRPWLQIDLGQPARIRYLELYTRAQIDQPEGRRNFELRASNDPTFATYVVLGSQGSTALPHEAIWQKEIGDGGSYRYIRAAKTADEGFFITELRVLGQR